MSKIYIAGPMSGLRGFNRKAFFTAAFHLSEAGHVVLNPAMLPDGLSEREYMDICLAMIRCADGIFLLDGWQRSAGAKAEYVLAEKLGLEIQRQVEVTTMEKKPSEVCSAEIDHEHTQGSGRHLLGQSMRGSDLQRLAMLCKPPMPNSPETPMCSSGGACGHSKKNQRPDDCNQPQYEYLSLALPVDPAFPVQLYGAVDAVDARFVMRAELLLSILRSVGSILANAPQSAGQSLFDRLLKEASALLCAYPCTVKEDRNPEANQMQDEA